MQKIKRFSKILLFLSILGGVALLPSVCFGQKVDGKQRNKLTKINEKLLRSKPIETIINFWNYSQNGKLEEAKLLRTEKYKGIKIGIKKDESYREWEEIIFDSEMSFVSIEQVEILDTDKWDVAVKVKAKDGKLVYLFHTVVKSENNWKIHRISF